MTGCGCGKTCWDAYSPDVQVYAEAVASMLLWAATGRRYGLCTVTVQPCQRPDPQPLYQAYPVGRDVYPGAYEYGGTYVYDGAWLGSGCRPSCSCSAGRCEVALAGPTAKSRITSVTVDGTAVPDTSYTVFNGYLLTRIDGECWPTCTNYAASTPGFEVTYQRGEPIPTGVQQATNRLACEIAKACAGAACGLPERVRTLTRQGVQVQFADWVDDRGRVSTGVAAVDRLVRALNPHGLAQPPAVTSPDAPAPRMVT